MAAESAAAGPGSVTAEAVTFNGGSYLKITNANTGATAFIQATGSDETYEILFTNGINGEVIPTYQVTGTEITKKA